MQLTLKDGLPFISVRIAYGDVSLGIPNVLLDTGSAGTIISADIASHVNLIPEPNDKLLLIRGVGGTEAVFIRNLDFLQIGTRRIPGFQIEIGAVDYGFEINGILGIDALMAIDAVIDLGNLTLIIPA